ncbi:sensor histidine kinase [Sulfurospirillum sp. 1307]
MSKTIDDFKEFYNPNSKEKSFCLYDSIKKAIKLMGGSLSFYNIKIDLHVEKSLHVNGCSSSEFSQVVLNMLANIRDVAIKRKINNSCVMIYTKIKNKKLYLFIEDNCGGVKEENIEKIFEPYFTTKYNHGTGIGLYMCKIIIENKLGGKLSAKNLKSGLFRQEILFDSYIK